jgi:hypothetical protein
MTAEYQFARKINSTKNEGIIDLKSMTLLCICNEENARIILAALKVAENLPSDEEIEKWAYTRYHEAQEARWFNPLCIGAKWARDYRKEGQG